MTALIPASMAPPTFGSGSVGVEERRHFLGPRSRAARWRLRRLGRSLNGHDDGVGLATDRAAQPLFEPPHVQGLFAVEQPAQDVASVPILREQATVAPHSKIKPRIDDVLQRLHGSRLVHIMNINKGAQL